MNPLGLVILISAIGALYAIGNEVKAMKYPPCNTNEEWLDTSEKPPMCRPCTPCTQEEKELLPCTETKDRVCSYCEPGYVWSVLESFCRPCGCCNGKHQVQLVCLAAGFSANEACMADGPCPPTSSNLTSAAAAIKDQSTNNKTNIVLVVVLAVLALATLGICVLLGLYCIWRHRKKKNTNQQPLPLIVNGHALPQDEELALSEEETTVCKTEFSGNDAVPETPDPTLTSVYDTTNINETDIHCDVNI